MNWRRFFIVPLMLIAFEARAQSSPEVQVLSDRLLKELSQSIACSVESTTIKAELAKVQAELKALKEKPAQ